MSCRAVLVCVQHEICVTHGANQAFVNLVLSLVDEGDRVVLFTPAYFDHVMVGKTHTHTHTHTHNTHTRIYMGYARARHRWQNPQMGTSGYSGLS